MFRHKNHAEEDAKKVKEALVAEEKETEKIGEIDKVPGHSTGSGRMTGKDASPEALRELLEKNLKWSQIIYEQNRRINSKLFWQALAGWLRLLIILVPIVLAVIFLPPILNDVWKQYQGLLGQVSDIPKDYSSPSLEKLLKLLPLDPAKQEQLKTILK